MVSTDWFTKFAASLPGSTIAPHFEKTSFRVQNKIFATLSGKGLACLKLSPIDQSVFCSFDKEIIYPVPNKWGIQGWTYFDLTKIKRAMIQDALELAWKQVAEKNKPSKKKKL